MYRRVPYGGLVDFAVLDTRQYRTDQPCGDGTKAPCEGVFDPKATIMGDVQEAWLKDTLDKSPAKWNIIANQVLMARIDQKPGPEEALSMDQWSGYEVCRDRLMKFLAERKPSNPIVITGDIHSNWVSDLKVDWKDEKSPVVGTEFTGTSISSGGDGVDERPTTKGGLRRESPSEDVQRTARVCDGDCERRAMPRGLSRGAVRDQARRADPDALQLGGGEWASRRSEGVAVKIGRWPSFRSDIPNSVSPC